MSGTYWGNGRVDYDKQGGIGYVTYFENNGVVWYDCDKGIALPGWQAELEPYEGEAVGWNERPKAWHLTAATHD